MTKHLDEAERLLLKANECNSGGVLHSEYIEHAVLELTRHLRATATPHVSVPALPIDAEDERVVDELFHKRAQGLAERRMRVEPPPGETGPEPFKLGRALYGSIPWNACEKPAGMWEDAETWERQAWDDVARNLYEAGKQSAADEIAELRERLAAWETVDDGQPALVPHE